MAPEGIFAVRMGKTILREVKVAQKGREVANCGEPEIEFRAKSLEFRGEASSELRIKRRRREND